MNIRIIWIQTVSYTYNFRHLFWNIELIARHVRLWDGVFSYPSGLEHTRMVTMQPEQQRWIMWPDGLPINNAAPLIDARSLTWNLSVRAGISSVQLPFVFGGSGASCRTRWTSNVLLQRRPWSSCRRNPRLKRVQVPRTIVMVNRNTWRPPCEKPLKRPRGWLIPLKWTVTINVILTCQELKPRCRNSL